MVSVSWGSSYAQTLEGSKGPWSLSGSLTGMNSRIPDLLRSIESCLDHLNQEKKVYVMEIQKYKEHSPGPDFKNAHVT